MAKYPKMCRVHNQKVNTVLLDVPSSLVWACSGRARLLAIHKPPEAFGAKEGLHLFTPGDIVGSSEGLDAMQVGLVF